mgnify:FL=1
MGEKHFNAKHDDATWRALFRRWHAGEASKALRVEAGVSAETWHANAKRLGMRIGDLPADDPARRRIPAFAERAGDYRHPKSRLNEQDWLRLLTLRARGVRGNLLAEVFGVAGATICSQAKARGLEPPHVTRRAGAGFQLDWDDPEGTLLGILNAMLRAVEEGRHGDYRQLERVFGQVEREFRSRGWRGPVGARPSAPSRR